MRSLTFVVAGMAGIVLAGTARGQARPPGTTVHGELGERLESAAIAGAAALDGGYWGAMLVASEGEIVFARAFGAADRGEVGGRRRPMSTKAIFDLGATGQLLTNLLVLRLVEAGKLQLSDPVAEHVSDWPADRKGITLGHLMRHDSGLSTKGKWPNGTGMSDRRTLAQIARAPLVGRPGEKPHYTDLNPILLALCVENAVGRYDTQLERLVLKPFGMKGADAAGGSFSSRYLTNRRLDKGDERVDKVLYNWHHRGVDGVLGSVFDVHALLDNVTGDKLLDDRSRELWWRPVPPGRLRIEEVDVGGHAVVRIEGRCGGYGTRWTIHRKSRSWVVLWGDNKTGFAPIEAALVEVLGDTFRPAEDPPAEDPPAEAPPAKDSPVEDSPAADDASTASTAPPASRGEQQPAPSAAGPAAQRFVGTFVVPGGGRFVIRQRGDGLRLLAEGVEPSVRLLEGRWPGRSGQAARQRADRGIAVLERLARGDATVIDEAFVNAAGARAASDAIAGLLARHGDLRGVRYIGSVDSGGRVDSWFALDFDRHAATLAVRWRGQRRFSSCRHVTEEPPFAVELKVVGPDLAMAAALVGTPLRLTMEGRPGSRTLVFEDLTPGDDGLIDCESADR